MKRTIVIVGVILLFLVNLVSTCAGNMNVPLGLKETFYGVKQVITSQPGTFAMMDEDMIILAWPRGVSYAYAMFCERGNCNALGLEATKISTMKFYESIAYLRGAGWQYVEASALPAWLTRALAATTVESFAAATQGLTTIWAFPVVGFYSTATPAKN